MNSKSILYVALWPEDVRTQSLEHQFVELQTYCLLRNLEISGVEQDIEATPQGGIRPGLSRTILRMKREGITHLVVRDLGQMASNSSDAVFQLRKWLESGEVIIHIAEWTLSSEDEEFRRTLARFESLLRLDKPAVLIQDPQKLRDTLRRRPLWKRMFGLLRDERYAEFLIQALFEVKDCIRLNEKENEAVHGGYDHLQMFRALGFRIKGEDTDNARLVADVLAQHWDAVKPRLGDDLCRKVESSEGTAPATGTFL